MRKLIAIALCLCSLLSMSTGAFAATINEDGAQSSTTTVTYGVESSYTVTIPDSITLDNNGEGDINISIANVLLPSGRYLCGFMQYDEALEDTTNSANTISYWIGSGEHVNEPGDLCLIGSSGVVSDSYTFVLHCDEAPRFSGTYVDTITFEFEIRALQYFELYDGDTYGEVCTVGMTFAEWVESPYNIHRWDLGNLLTSREISPDGHEVITAGHQYVLGMEGGAH